MRKLFFSVVLLASLVLSQTVAADSRDNRRSYNSHSYNSHYRGNDRHRSRHYSSYRANPYHYGVSRNRGYNTYYGSRSYRRHDNDAGVFVGGLVLGSLLSYPYYSRPVERVIYRNAPVVHTKEVVVVRNSNAAPVAGRRLLRDLGGNCFEVISDEDGNEIRLQLAASECSF